LMSPGEKTIGILGGMGPEATAELFLRIIRAAKAKRDQDHPRVIIYSNSKIPDRTGAILHGGPSPLPMMVETGRILQRAGADFLIMPCNTAHHYFQELQEALEVPVLHMIDLSARVAQALGVGRVGLLATDGTLATGLYQESYGRFQVETLAPSPQDQKRVMEAIYTHIKAGDLEEGRKLILEVSRALIQEGAEAVVCGCTEVSLVLRQGDLEVPVIDPLETLAEEAVKLAKG